MCTHLKYVILSILMLLTINLELKAQEYEKPVFTNAFRFGFGLNSGFSSFKGEYGNTGFNGNNMIYGIEPSIEYQSWRFSTPIKRGNISWQNREEYSGSNFRNQFNCADLRASYRLFQNPNVISPFIGIGFGGFAFSVYQDLFDTDGNSYFYWSDGTIRNMEESQENLKISAIIERDYEFETTTINNERLFYIPITAGIASPLGSNFRLNISYSYYFLQGDNFDGNIENSGWDKLSGIEIGFNYIFRKKSKKDNSVKKINPRNLIDYSTVDFSKIESEDEDFDGVVDLIDQCFGTPAGAPVDEFGCPKDSDNDGIIDFLDAEPDSPLNSRVHPNGIAWTDEEYLTYTNDSLAYFVSTLRKVNKNSRPYPIKKHIRNESYLTWNKILEQHPDWQKLRMKRSELLPNEFRILDKNKDNFLSILELEDAIESLFEEDANKKLNEDLIRRAIEYAFRNQ